jgi:hypothetical protein
MQVKLRVGLAADAAPTARSTERDMTDIKAALATAALACLSTSAASRSFSDFRMTPN